MSEIGAKLSSGANITADVFTTSLASSANFVMKTPV
jgi:hypothetical protein